MPATQMKSTRRELLKTAAPAALTLAGLPWSASGADGREKPAPVRPITRGPKFHWFGYYDKLEFDPTCRYVLGMEVDFDHRLPKADDVVKIGMVDLENDDRWIELDESRMWSWQQGCMLQWRPGSNSEIMWNDRQGDRFVCRFLDVKTGKKRTLSYPVFTVGHDGRTAVTLDFRRLSEMRPACGCAVLPDPHRDELAPKDSGIFRIDLETGRRELVVSLADIAGMPCPLGDLSKAKHYFNHLVISPDGERILFLHRWRPLIHGGLGRRSTRLLTVAMDGSDARIVDHSGHTSHIVWRDPRHVLAWTKHKSHGFAFYLFEDKTDGKAEIVGKDVMSSDGHCLYLPGNQWILNDTYPDSRRKQEVYLYHVPAGRKVSLGRFYSPPRYKGPCRCDTHPRFSPDARSVVIDSPHTSHGRQMHLIDISRIV